MALLTGARAELERTDRIFGFGITVITGGTGVGVANGFEEVVLAVPTVLGMLYAYVFQVYARAIAMGIARGRIEEVLAQQLRASALIYESRIAPLHLMPTSTSLLVLWSLIFGGLFMGSGVAGVVIVTAHGLVALVVYSVFTLGSGGMAALSVRDTGRLSSKARRAVATWPRDQ